MRFILIKLWHDLLYVLGFRAKGTKKHDHRKD